MDALSEVLKVVKLEGAFFYHGDSPRPGASIRPIRANWRPSFTAAPAR